MVYVRLVVLALLASLYEVSHGASSRRARAGSVSLVPAPTCLPATSCPCRRYERTLEDIISKLINALIYTTIRNVGGGTGASGCGGTSRSEDPLLDLNLAGQDLIDVDLLPGLIGGSSGTGGGSCSVVGGSGGVSTGSGVAGVTCGCSECGATSGGSCAGSDGSITDVVKLLENLLNLNVQLTDDNNVIKICLLGGDES